VATVAAAIAVVLASGPARAQAPASAPEPAAKPGEAAPAGKPAAAGRAAKAAKPAKPVKIDVGAQRAALNGADQEGAVAAATKLGQSRQPGALDALLDGLAIGLHPAVAAVALDGVAHHGSARAFDVVGYYAHNRNAKVRAAAVRAMASLDDGRTAEPLLRALTDLDEGVRAAAAQGVAQNKLRKGIEPLLKLLAKGDDAAGQALAALADPDLARAVGELIGQAPDGALARSLGAMLMRPDFKPEDARVEVVRALGKISGTEALEALTTYVASIPENPPRQSRREAEALVEAKLAGGSGGGN
jgi:HEAT repeat protein